MVLARATVGINVVVIMVTAISVDPRAVILLG